MFTLSVDLKSKLCCVKNPSEYSPAVTRGCISFVISPPPSHARRKKPPTLCVCVCGCMHFYTFWHVFPMCVSKHALVTIMVCIYLTTVACASRNHF